MTLEEFSKLEAVTAPKLLPDGRVAFIYPLLYTAAICVGQLDQGGCYDDRWCYTDTLAALRALRLWDGTGEPQGWHRHPSSGRRRPEGDASKEYVSA